MKTSFIVAILLLLGFTPIWGQINFNSPQGTYYFTSKSGKNFKLIINPPYDTGGRFRHKGSAEMYVGDYPVAFHGNYDTCYDAPSLQKSNYIRFDFDTRLDNHISYYFEVDRNGWIYPGAIFYPKKETDISKRFNKTPCSKTPPVSPQKTRSSDSQSSQTISSNYIPIKAKDFATATSTYLYEFGKNKIDWSFWLDNKYDYLRNVGFVIQNGGEKIKRDDLTIWTSHDLTFEETEQRNFNTDYIFVFATPVLAKDFWETFSELGWEKDGSIYRSDGWPYIISQLDGSVVKIKRLADY